MRHFYSSSMLNSTIMMIALSILSFTQMSAQCGNAYIAGVVDGPLSGGTPKMIQICASADIADLSLYSVGTANNGGGTDGEEFTFPNISLTAGDCVTLASESTQFEAFFGCAPDYTDGAASINGDDAIELFCNGVVEDLFGDINTDGSGEPWEYADGWAFATDAVASATFSLADWNFSSPDALDGATNNISAPTPYPSDICSNCAITALGSGFQTTCVVTDNSYTQEVTVTYANPPSTGMLVVNGQSFVIGSSPQMVLLTGLNSDGSPVDVTASFSTNTVCSFTEIELFTAPVQCGTPPCAEVEIDAYAFCADAANNFVEGSYYVEVAAVSGGSGSGSFDVSIGAVTLAYTGSALVFGPFTHSGAGNIVQTILAVETGANACTGSAEVVETLCSDLSGDGIADNDFVSCNCIAAATGDNGGTILAQAAPGTFSAGGSSGFLQHYLVVDANSGTTMTIVSNTIGLFTNLPAGTYYVYAINYKLGEAPNVVADFTFGSSIDITALATNGAPYDTDCYTACGPATYEVVCGADAASVACNGHINVTLGAFCDASQLNPSQFVEGHNVDYSRYSLTIETQSGETVDYKNETISTDDDVFNFIGDDLVYIINDLCSGSTCWGYVTLEDKTPPQLDCDCPVGGVGGTYTPECTYSCYEVSLLEGFDNLPSDIDQFVNNSIEDNCFNYEVDNVWFEDDLSDFGMCGGSVLRRTWIVSYKAKDSDVVETVSCTREYAFAPLDLSTAITANGPVMNPQDNTVYLPVRTVELDCVISTDPGSIATSEGEAYAYPHLYVNGTAVGIDGTVCNITTTYSDTEVEGCGASCSGDSKTLRSWTILDWCTSEIEEYLQVIKLIDEDGPLLSVGDDINAMAPRGSCRLDLDLPAPQILSDFCDTAVSYSVDGTSGGHDITGNANSGFTAVGLGVGTHEIYYSARDCCGNESFDTLIVTIKDDASPNAIAEEFIVVTVNRIGNNEVFGRVSAIAVDNGSYDNCSDVTLHIKRAEDSCNPTDDEWGEAVHFCCEDLDENGRGEVTVQLLVTDECGNTNSVYSIIHVEDKGTDVLTCPDGMLRNCGDAIGDLSVTGSPSTTGVCGAVSKDYEVTTEPASKPANEIPLYDIDNDGTNDMVPPYDSLCGYGALKREFKDGNEVICTQYFVYTSSESLDPNTINWPADITVNCSNYNLVEPSFSAPACGNVAVTLKSDTFPDLDGYCYAVLNTWTVIDWCTFEKTRGAEGRFSMVQDIKVSDTSAPVIGVEPSMTFDLSGDDCELDNVSIAVTAMDNDGCPNENLNWAISVDFFGDGSIDEQQTAQSFPGDTFDINLTQVPATKTSHLITWSATDDCGNTTLASTSFTVNDVVAPQPYCIGVTTTVDTTTGSFELWAVDFDAGASDNCTSTGDLRFTFSNLAPPSSTGYYDSFTGATASVTDFLSGTADSYNAATNSAGRVFTELDLDINGALTVPVFVWDECGNNDFCVVTTVIQPTLVGSRTAIQGSFMTELGEPIVEVEATMVQAHTGKVDSMMTELNGHYAFDNNLMHMDYRLEGRKDHDYLNGVSTLDLIQMQRHILGQSMLDSPYKMIAADVNNDKVISGTDLVELRKLILGVIKELPQVESWKFIDESQELTLDNPWIYKDSLMLHDLSEAMMHEDFIGVKMGDVDISNIPSQTSSRAFNRSSGQMLLVYEDQTFIQNQEVELLLSVSELELYGYQFALSFDKLQLVDATGRDIATENILIEDTVLRISHNSDYLISSEEEFLRLKFTALENGKLSEVLKIDDTKLSAEGYVGKYLEVNQVKLATKNQSGFKLYQNRPNPFSEETIIEFDLPEASEVKLSLYDITGKKFKVVTQKFDQGHHSLSLSKNELGTSGVIYYRLESGEFTAMKQMIILE